MSPGPGDGHCRRAFRALLPTAALACAAACEHEGRSVVWRTLGELPAPAATALNHTPLTVSGERILVGTADGLWARSLDGGGKWTPTGLAGVGIFAMRVQPGNDTTVFAAGMPAADPAAPPFYRSDDAGMNWTGATTFPRNPFDASSEPFYDLAVAPDDPERIYANLSGPSVAISTDGGMNWALANGETEVFFGDPCVIHVLESAPGLLYQGCEAPLDDAWVATQAIDPDDPLMLADFTFVAGGPDFALENRRPNAMASGAARPDTLYVGLEGALIALDPEGFQFVFRAEDNSGELPYAYVTAVWADPDDGGHLVFGGGINGENTVFSLFETFDGGATLRRIPAPEALVDPAVEQIVPVADGSLAVLVSHVDELGDASRRLTLYLLESGG
jgi:hypothetical protein